LPPDKNYEQKQLPPLRTFKFVSPGLLKTMGNRLIAGRDLVWEDAYDKRKVAMVSDNLARELWGSPGAALGKQIRESNSSTGVKSSGSSATNAAKAWTRMRRRLRCVPMLMTKFEGDDPSVRRTMSYVIRSPRAGHRAAFTSEVGPRRVVRAIRTCRCAASGQLDAGRQQVDGADVVHARHAGDSRERWRCCWASPASTA
jgi:hypothetical protein